MSYVIIGSGIVGLYTCFNLIEKGVTPSEIQVLAEYLPGDQSINYTSPWAGGNFSCISPDDENTLKFDKYTYTNLHRIQKLLGGPSCGLDNRKSREFWDYIPSSKKMDSLAGYLKDYKVLSNDEFPDEEAKFGLSYTSWNFDCPSFLANFQKYLISKGVLFKRQKVNHISEAFKFSNEVKAVFNCSGIGAKTLKGAEDKAIYPGRGQVLVIKAPHINENRMRWGKNDKTITYIIPRPHSKGQVILGGYLQKNNWTPDTWNYESDDILSRTTSLYPEILDEELEIIRVAAGLRPCREGGVKIAKEKYAKDQYLIHISGLSGYGYQAGLGASKAGVDLYFDNDSRVKSKL